MQSHGLRVGYVTLVRAGNSRLGQIVVGVERAVLNSVCFEGAGSTSAADTIVTGRRPYFTMAVDLCQIILWK